MTIRRALLVALVTLLGATSAHGQEGFDGIEITPSRFEHDLPDREFSIKILFVNHEPGDRRVSLSVAGLGHNLAGDPQYLEPAIASRVTELSAREFVLPPEGKREILVGGAIPDTRRSLYFAVIAEFEPLRETEGAIEVRRRVAGLFLLRGPEPWRESVKVADVGVVGTPPSDPGKVLTLYAAAYNDGNVHVRPTGYIDVFDGDKLLDTVRLQGDVIIPGFARRLVGRWRPPPGLDGEIRLEATLRNPTAAGSGEIDFSEGEAERPGAEISNLVASDEDGGQVSLEITNTGNIPIAPTVTLVATEDGFERTREVLAQDDLAIGEGRPLEWEPGLAEGLYLITATATLGDDLLSEAATGLQIGGGGADGGAGNSILRWIALALLIGVSLGLAWFLSERRREVRDAAH